MSLLSAAGRLVTSLLPMQREVIKALAARLLLS
jgi:hypothetical protein